MDIGPRLFAEGIEIAFAGLVGTAGFALFRHKGNTAAEGGAYGLMAMLMLHAWLAQVLLFMGWPHLFIPVQGVLLAAALSIIARHRRLLAEQIIIVGKYVRVHWAAVGSMLLAWSYLAAAWGWKAAPAVGPDAGPWLNGSLLRTAQVCRWATAAPVLNHVILLARWQPATAAGIANLTAYVTIGLATYALARRYAWPPTAVTVALLVVSMPRLAHQCLVPYSELLPAAAALVTILALYRAAEQPHAHDVVMLTGALAFSVAGGRLCYVMPSVLAALCLMVLGRRHDVRLWPQAMRRHLAAVAVAAALALVFSQVLTVAVNMETGRSWIGELAPDRIALNTDGPAGLAANMVRHILQSIQLPESIDRFGRWAFGVSALAGVKLLYRSVVAPLIGGKGAAAVFDLSWASKGGGGWFGPVGFALVLPSLINAFWRGPYRLRTTALAMTAYWVLIALIAAWQPSNVHLMTPLFVGAGFMMAFFLPPWRLGRKGRLVLQLLGMALLAGDVLL